MIPYNPDLYATGFGFLRIIFALRGTVIPHVLKSGMFWMTLVVHIVFHIIVLATIVSKDGRWMN